MIQQVCEDVINTNQKDCEICEQIWMIVDYKIEKSLNLVKFTNSFASNEYFTIIFNWESVDIGWHY